MRKILSAVLVLVMMVTLMVPSVMAAEPETAETSVTVDANGGGFTNQLLSAEKPEAEAEENDSNLVANIIVFAVLAVVVGVSVARIIDKKKKLYK